MKNNAKYNKTDYIRAVMSTIEHDSFDKEKSKEYLKSQGVNVDTLISDGLQKIKKIQMQINANKTRAEMNSMERVKQKATDLVENLMSKINFSFPTIVKEEKMLLSFRNLESLSNDDIKNILIKHFILKFSEEQEIK